jgi:hypothetical protein
MPAPERFAEVGEFASEIEIPLDPSFLVGQWVTSSEYLYPGTGQYFAPGAIIFVFNLKSDGTFLGESRRNLLGNFNDLRFMGDYDINFDAPLGVVKGVLNIRDSGGVFILDFIVKSRDELVWLMARAIPSDSRGDARAPIAQGTMHRVRRLP